MLELTREGIFYFSILILLVSSASDLATISSPAFICIKGNLLSFVKGDAIAFKTPM